jgi:excinuclease ABC subunit A
VETLYFGEHPFAVPLFRVLAAVPNSKRERLPPDDGFVHVRGARQHNLRSIDVDLPRNALVAFTGVSGSGKSSLAFGTIYAEAQRRYFESVAPYARRLIQQMEVPKVGEITGLPPAIALQQRRGSPSSRSTVGTLTTLSNLVRMLYSRAGTYPLGAPSLEAEAFSPSTATGACAECEGLGTTVTVTEELVVPDATLTIREGAVAAWPKAWQGVNLRDILTTLGYNVDKPWSKLSRKQRTWILFTDEQPVVLVHPSADRNEGEYYGRFWSAKSYVMHTLANTTSDTMRDRAMRFVERIPCPVCGGSGLRPEALTVTFAGLNIHELNHVQLRDLAEVLGPHSRREDVGRASQSDGSGNLTGAATTIVVDVLSRLQVLLKLGLGYLSLSRTTPTLSAGEMQRLRLATQLRSGLFGVVYVLDEPSAGLHPADAEPLLEVLDQLKAAGNSLFVVEHDMDIVRDADWVVDIGPGAGEHGGRVLYNGPVAGLAQIKGSATSRHLFSPPPRFHATPRAPAAWIHLGPIDRHNLHDVTVNLPVGLFTAVTGVSGSGKSTLVTQVLARTVAHHLGVHDEADVDARLLTATLSLWRGDWSRSRGWCALISVRSVARPAQIWRPTPACSIRCANSSPQLTKPFGAATPQAASRSTSPMDDARPARATVSCRSNSSSYRAHTRRAPHAAVRASTLKPLRSPGTERTSPMCSN